MASRGTVLLSEILDMLEVCAKGYKIREKPHMHWVLFNGKIYPALPKGAHGSKTRAEIEVGHLRKMIRFLGIDEECAKKHLPILK